jgi:triacylglycerol lipase
MSAPNPVKPEPSTPADLPNASSEVQVRLHDTLAGGQRLWIRGAVVGLLTSRNGQGEARRWWRPWRKDDAPAPPTSLHLETRISSTVLEADVPVEPDGSFEATFTTHLAPARRGWRVGRNCVRYGEHQIRACNVVLVPPEDARAAVIVLLPLQGTYPAGGIPRLVGSKSPPQLGKLVRNLQRSVRGSCPVYYLACVPPDRLDCQPELALAVAALGWPTGHFLLFAADSKEAPATFAAALDRLRWLFAGSLDLWLLNLEPDAEPALESALAPTDDRAPVGQLTDFEDDPVKTIAKRRPGAAAGTLSGLRPTRSVLVPRYPIVFCHGMLAFSMLKMYHPEEQNYFTPLREFLRQRGFRVLFPEVPATSGVVERAVQLREQILRWTDEPVNLIAHSMGGLDSRYMITHLGMAERVRSLTTIGTPHRGSHLADWFVANYRQRLPLLVALEAFGLNVDGFRDCRPAICREFNANTPNMPGVQYFSFGGEVPVSRLTPFLRRAWSILTPVEGPNDGLVSVASARWGEYLGTIPADHFAQTPDAVFLRSGENFDALGFFSRLLENLARRGF